jgi:hypothetical protein
MLASIETLIRRFHGHIYEVAGVVFGYFDDPAQTCHCAHEIRSLIQRDVELCGCQLSIVLDSPRRAR